jgi:hypothetical protein
MTDSEKIMIQRLLNALQPLIDIAQAYDDNALDDEARKFWGPNDEHRNTTTPNNIELYTGRGGRRLLTLEDCLNARADAYNIRLQLNKDS